MKVSKKMEAKLRRELETEGDKGKHEVREKCQTVGLKGEKE